MANVEINFLLANMISFILLLLRLHIINHDTFKSFIKFINMSFELCYFK